jgi:hypothetical protein
MLTSANHTEINPSDVGFADRIVVQVPTASSVVLSISAHKQFEDSPQHQEIIKEIAQSQSLGATTYKGFSTFTAHTYIYVSHPSIHWPPVCLTHIAVVIIQEVDRMSRDAQVLFFPLPSCHSHSLSL